MYQNWISLVTNVRFWYKLNRVYSLKKINFKLPSFQRTRLDKFIDDYNFTSKDNIDTLGWCVEIINGDTLTSYSIELGVDGIDIMGSNNSEENNNNLQYTRFRMYRVFK